MLHPLHYARLRKLVTTPEAVRKCPTAVQDAWLQLKEEQRREDGTSARIEPQHLAHLEAAPSHYPAPEPVTPLMAALAAAEPAVLAAVKARRARDAQASAGRPTGGDAA
ncbi:hypothetical protein [Salipiger mucosus]|uniref:Uncharacterized protein n=1 Tax=Salipiger mucosus DSM 16094 TaxID=1123237 RepID=S9RVR1_9RHOB|nr:hypothetical protein [Salipiger mucosus]EPX82075.1 hypothetical protein Salmuc_02442 [Salipiger mucosus DSM 16094]